MTREALAGSTVHLEWNARYRTKENERFYEMAFDAVAASISPPSGTVLDVGCGTGRHAARLARRGYRVVGVDFSDYILARAREHVATLGVEEHIRFQQDDATALSFRDASFDHCLLWGVGMHIPKVELALTELARVLKPGGYLVISEANAGSAQARLVRFARRWRGRPGTIAEHTPQGYETWATTPNGMLVTRQAKIKWLTAWLTAHGFSIKSHRAGQFTELYTRLKPGLAQRMIHAWNALWFRYVRLPAPAFGNIIIAQKNADPAR